LCLAQVSGYSVANQDRYAAIWEAKPCPAFVARHGMTAPQYQQAFDQLVGKDGFRLVWIDAD
jgi:Bacterial tandem repeat domain 1